MGDGKLGRIVEDIFTLEVNTILCDGMTGEQMLDPRHALFDIGVEYIRELEQLLGAGTIEIEKDANGPIRGSREVFQALHDNARAFQSTAAHEQCTGPQRTLVQRIKVKSGQLVALFDRLPHAGSDTADKNAYSRSTMNLTGKDKPPPMQIDRDDRIFIRKAWEMSTEEIAMQTSITLDGDVISRIQRDYASKDHETLHRLHGEGVKIALSSWSMIITAIKDVIKAFT